MGWIYTFVRLLVNTDSQWSRVVNIDKTHVANLKLKRGNERNLCFSRFFVNHFKTSRYSNISKIESEP